MVERRRALHWVDYLGILASGNPAENIPTKSNRVGNLIIAIVQNIKPLSC